MKTKFFEMNEITHHEITRQVSQKSLDCWAKHSVIPHYVIVLKIYKYFTKHVIH